MLLDRSGADGLPQFGLIGIEIRIAIGGEVRPQADQTLDALVLSGMILQLARQRIVEEIREIVAVAGATHLLAAAEYAQVIEVLRVEIEAVQIGGCARCVLQARQYCAIDWKPEILVRDHLQGTHNISYRAGT